MQVCIYIRIMWLAVRNRLPTNDRRFRHHMSADAQCPICPLDEDLDHLLIGCPNASEVWSLLFPSAPAPASTLAELLDDHARSFAGATICTAVAWHIWKRRNNKVFNGIIDPPLVTVRSCIADVRLWAHRCRSQVVADHLLRWCTLSDPP